MTKYFLSFLCFLVPVFSIAQGNLSELSLEDLLQVEVYSATRSATTLIETPLATSVFSAKEIEQLGVTNLKELVNYVPGLQSYRQEMSGGHKTVSSRGRKTGGSGIVEIVILIDGMRIAEGGNSGSGDIASTIPLHNIEKVEFVRGPVSSLYGSNAMTGLISLTTKSSVNSIQLGGGSHSSQAANVLLSKRYNDFTIDLHGSFLQADGKDYNVSSYSSSNPETSDPSLNKNVHLKMKYKDTFLKFFHTEQNYSDFFVFNSLNNDHNKVTSDFSGLLIGQDIYWKNVSTNITLMTNKTKLRVEFAGGSLNSINTLNSNENTLRVHNSIKAGKHLLGLGADVKNQEVEKAVLQFVDGGSSVLVEPRKRNIYGVYLLDQFSITDRYSMVASMRYDQYEGHDEHLSSSVGIIAKIDSNNTLKLHYGEAYRAPSLAEMGLQNNPVILGDEKLRPEVVKTTDLIWLHSWNTGYYSLGLFYNVFVDSIFPDSNSPSTYVNSPRSKSSGTEFEIHYNFSKSFKISGTYFRMFTVDDKSFREAIEQGSLALNLKRGLYNINLNSVYHGARKYISGTTKTEISPYVIVNLSTVYSLSNSLKMKASIKNIMDKSFLTPPQNTTIGNGIPNKEREIFGEVEYTF